MPPHSDTTTGTLSWITTNPNDLYTTTDHITISGEPLRFYTNSNICSATTYPEIETVEQAYNLAQSNHEHAKFTISVKILSEIFKEMKDLKDRNDQLEKIEGKKLEDIWEKIINE